MHHRRGRSLESGIACDEKEDDLALFNQVQNKEKEGFLLQSNYDFNDIFPMNLQDFKMPARGETNDLLNAVDKNDYDWLMTPPETPLFSSLDDEVPLLLRGRPRTQPVAISPSSMDDRSRRASPSPRRMSPSPRSGNSMLLQGRSRSSSASRSSTTPTSSRAPPCKPIVPAISSRSMSTGSTASGAQFGTRGMSPVKTSFENYESPKIRAWQLNIPGFSSEVPPNLRTSLADRPRSYVRGSSPASRNGSRSGRQSMSPSASGSASSSHCSRGSIALSGDDDSDSLPSKTLSFSVQRNIGSLPKNRSSGLYRKSTKTLSSSAPKRSFDMNKKSPHNMLRPLLSNAPSSTLYAGKGSTRSLSLISRNCSDQVTSEALSIVEPEHKGNDMSCEFVKNPHPVIQAEASNENTERAAAMELCSKCCFSFPSIILVMDGDRRLCRKCKGSEANTGLVCFDEVENTGQAISSTEHKQKKLFDLCLNSEIDIQEGTRLSLLLKRSSSVKGDIVPRRSYDEFFYLRDSFRSLKSSTAQSSTSMSSSFERMEAHRHRELGGSKHKRSISLPPHHMLLVPGMSEYVKEGSKTTDFVDTSTSEDDKGKKWTRNHMQICCSHGEEYTPLDALDSLSETEFDTPSIESLDVVTPLDEPKVVSTAKNGSLDASISVTLEEATDVILLSSSIVDEIALTRAPKPYEVPRSVTPGSKQQRKKEENEAKSPQSVLDENEGKSTPRIVLPPGSVGNSTVESKCNCSIM